MKRETDLVFSIIYLVLAAVDYSLRRTHRGVVMLHYHAVRRMSVKKIHEGFWDNRLCIGVKTYLVVRLSRTKLHKTRHGMVVVDTWSRRCVG